MGAISSLDLGIRRFEFGMSSLVLQLANHKRSIPRRYSPSPTLPRGGTSFLNRITGRLGFWIPRRVRPLIGLQSENLQLSGLVLTFPVGTTFIPDLMTTPPAWRSHPLLNHPPLVTQLMSVSFHNLTHEVGSEIQMAVYSIGYPQIVVVASIHLLPRQSL